MVMCMVLSSFRIAKQNGREAHFAEVDLRVVPCLDSQVVFDCPPDQIRGWEDAAKSGVQDAFKALVVRGYEPDRFTVVIERFVGLVSDTDDEDVRAAVFAAVVQAVSCMKTKPELVRDFAHRRWDVVW